MEALKNIPGVEGKAGKDLGAEQNEVRERKWSEETWKGIAFNHDAVWSAAAARTPSCQQRTTRGLSKGRSASICILDRLFRQQDGGGFENHKATGSSVWRILE